MKITTECKCCGKKICYPPALVCTYCAMTDPEAKAWLRLEQEKK